ncbi:hypothetical protein ACIQXI_05440 [Lysinibacillus sp. NPDC097195]|uniref:hypothetical protein n=1 Tax=Lysinibacillus sp. NPDC097195 TaxID=3364141 RepID=UPI0037FB75B3
MLLKIINSLIGMIIIFLGLIFMSITVNDESFKTFTYRSFGILIVLAGGFYLKTIAKLGHKFETHCSTVHSFI